MPNQTASTDHPQVKDFKTFAQRADYSLMERLHADPQATDDGNDHRARQVTSGHYVPVTPTAIAHPEYVAHSGEFFKELGLSDELAQQADFIKLFSGDMSAICPPMRPYGWATGYALSIYGTEYTQNCPFGTGNGYGDGRAISIFEGLFNAKRWEMQLKGGGPTPYCRGADGRAVLRSSVREFLAQEYMHALGVPSSRSLSLYVSKSETVTRPWYSEASQSPDPDIMTDNPVAISTRVAPSFLRVGQIELFARRARNHTQDQNRANDHTNDHTLEELRMIVAHLIEREYQDQIDPSLSFENQVVELAKHFRGRLSALVSDWLRVGYCQGNFNSDNCAAGGFTLDYGPFGFCEIFDTDFQPWTGGGQHFSFFNQPTAAEANFHMFWSALRPLLEDNPQALAQLDEVRKSFPRVMQQALETMWAKKFGLGAFNLSLFKQWLELMTRSEVDYTIFFRELSYIPEDIEPLKKSFYTSISLNLAKDWQAWLSRWRELLLDSEDSGNDAAQKHDTISERMKQVNPKYTWREWLIAPAYQQAAQGDYHLINELQAVFSQPYEEQSKAIEEKYYRLKPQEYRQAGGISHYSCSS